MKKQNLRPLEFKKESISNLPNKHANKIKGGTYYTFNCSTGAEEHRCDPCSY